MKVIFISIFVVIIDQLSKILVKGFSIPFLHFKYRGMYQGQRIPLIDDFFRLTYVENPGMAFGYDPGVDYKFFLSLFSLLATIGLLVYLYYSRKHSLSLRVSLSFILGGAAGNLIDRLLYGIFYGYAPLFHGKVVDFLDFDFFKITILGRSYDRFPIFNIADAAVTIGVLILIIFYKSHSMESEPAIGNNSSVIDNADILDIPSSEVNKETEQGSEDSLGEEQIPEKKKDTDGESDNGKEITV